MPTKRMRLAREGEMDEDVSLRLDEQLGDPGEAGLQAIDARWRILCPAARGMVATHRRCSDSEVYRV
jgi:hypothetical protein